MCQTVYHEHEKCTCIYVPVTFTPCAAYSLAHPEGLIRVPNPYADQEDPSTGSDPFADPEEPSTELDPFADPEEPQDPFADPGPEAICAILDCNPKLLTDVCGGLNFSYKDIDIVSFDVDHLRAPKGLKCSKGITARHAYRARGESKACLLCDRPAVLEIVEEMRKWRQAKEGGKGKGKEKEKGIFHKTAAAVKSFKGAGGSKAKKSENASGEGSAAAQEGKSKKNWLQKLTETPNHSMYLDPWGKSIPPFC